MAIILASVKERISISAIVGGGIELATFAITRGSIALDIAQMSSPFAILPRVLNVPGCDDDAAHEAELTGRTAHGLRKTRLTIIAENGGSAHAIMAWGGHKTLAEAQRYTQAAALKRLGFGNGTGPERSKPGPDSCKPAINRSTNKTLHGGW